MINVAISKSSLSPQSGLKEHIETLHSKAKNKLFNVSHINNLNDNTIDIFIINTENDYENVTVDNTKGYFIFAGNDLSKITINNNACNNYFVKSLEDYEKIDEILFHIRKKIQNNFIVIPTTQGDMKLRINELNYMDIESRALCYHLCSGEKLYSMTLTKSFQKAITPLDQNDLLLFIKPSLLINVSKIKFIDTNKIIFENGDSFWVASTTRRVIQEEWEIYHNFDNRYRS